MQTLTFTKKLLRQRRFLSFLLPLFAIFVGLGVQAQTITNTNFFVDNTPGTTNTTFGGSSGATPNFAGANFGSFDINNPNDLLLNGGELTFTSNVAPTKAQLKFQLYTSPAGAPGTGVDVGSPQFIVLGTPTVSGNVYTYSLSNAQRSLISLVPNAGDYEIDAQFVVDYGTRSNATSTQDVIRTAFFTVTGTLPVPSSVTFSNESVTVDQGAGPVNYAGTAFNTKLIDQMPGSTTTPAFDINNGDLILKGGTVTTTETGTFVVNGAFLDYTLFDPSFNAISNGTLQLTQTTPNPPTNGVRNFSLTTGTNDLITLVNNAGAGYTIQVTFHATYQENGTGLPSRANDPRNYNATFDVAGTRDPAPTVTGNTIVISPNGTSNVTYYFPSSASTPQFPGANLSSSANGGTSYDVNTGRLLLNNVTVTTTEAGRTTIDNVVLYYRTRLSTTPGGAFQAITLTPGTNSGGVRTFVIDPSTASQPNLIATPAVTAAGTYNVDVYFQANGRTNGTNFSITDPPQGAYSATFIVTGVPVAQTIWTGAKNDNWFDADNWSNGIPDATKNTLVRDFGTGNSIPYPNINAGVVVTTAGGAVLYDNTQYPFAATKNLILGGTSQANRSITRLVRGRLKVFGDFSNSFASFIQRENTIIEFAGSGTGNAQGANQVISGGSFVAVEVTGDGNKDLTGLMEVSQSITFIGGVLRTDITQPLLSLVILADRAPINNQNGAQILGENDDTYLRGFIRTLRQGVLVGETRTYGNMGMTLTFTGANSPGNVELTRNTVEAYAPVSGRFGIRRIFGVRPSDPATNTGGLQATMVFRYRSSETRNLNGTNTFTPGSAFIPEDRLTIFFSENGGGAFGLIGRDGPVDQVNKTVTRTGVTKFATITLGDQDNPLPVRLTSLDAKRFGSNALVTWQTATELNSKGYEVQVSNDGSEFRTLAFVASASPNSQTKQSYSFEDKEANKTGTRYYRLHQIDLDGKDAFFGPIAVNFNGAASATTTMVAYPNPFNSNDDLHVALQSTSNGKGRLFITDMTGRTVRQQDVSLQSGLTDVSIPGTGDLKVGMYLIKLTMPSGEVKNLKVMKQ